MSAELWPCTRCGHPGVRNVGPDGFCADHLRDLYLSFSPEVFAFVGLGLPKGRPRREYGDACHDLECVRCRATWVGVPGDACTWCEVERAAVFAHQAELLLTSPPRPSDDRRYGSLMAAWRDRLAVGVSAGLVTREQANAAWKREVLRHVDAA